MIKINLTSTRFPSPQRSNRNYVRAPAAAVETMELKITSQIIA